MALLSVDKDIRLHLEYNPRYTFRRWFLTATCRETGRRLTFKYATKPTAKELRRRKSFAKHSLKASLYWSQI